MREIILSLIALIILMPASWALPNENFDSAVQLFHAGQYKEAVKHLKKVTKKDPSNKGAWLLLGSCYSRLGKDSSAAKAYQKVIQIDPSHEEALFGLGMSGMRLDKYSVAIEAFKRVVENSPDHAQAHFQLGVSYEHKNWIGEAWEQHEILKTLDKKLADKLYHIIFW